MGNGFVSIRWGRRRRQEEHQSIRVYMLLRALFLVLHACLSFAEFFSHLLVAGCDIEVQISILLFVQLSVFPFFISYIKVCFSVEVVAVSVNPYIVIVLGNCIPVALTYISHSSNFTVTLNSILYFSDINKIYTVKLGAAGSSLTGVTELCSKQDTLILAKYWFNPGRPVPTI